MDQKLEGTPSAVIRLEGRKAIRGDVTNDWGLLLQWVVKRDGKVIATRPARADNHYEHPEATPGAYEIVLQMWKYIDYKKNADGTFVNSKFIDISNAVSYKI